MQNRKERTRLVTTLYVSDLKVNFLLIKRLCEMKLEESFDENDLYMRDKKERLVLRAFAFSDVYIVNKVTKELNEIAFIAVMVDDVINASIVLLFTKIESKIELTNSNDVTFSEFETSDSQLEAVNAFKLKKYKLWHRRFAHMSKIKLKNFHKIITLKKSISIVENFTLCKVCFTTKLTNARSRMLATRKFFILTLIFIDICEKLSVSWQDHRYFFKIVDNHSRKIWIILLKRRANAMKALRKWRLTVELKIEVRLLTVRNDNALKLKFILDEWKKFTGIEAQYNEVHTFKQNEIFERNIRITKNNIRVMIKKTSLLIEFWSKTATVDVYIRNRVDTSSVMNEERITFIETFEKVKSSIDHIRIWNCVCYFFVNFKSLLVDIRRNKFMNRDRRCVFLSYVKESDKQYWMWVFDLRRVIKHHKMIFSKHEKWENEKLNLFVQTLNEFLIRRPVERSRKIVFFVFFDLAQIESAAESVTEHVSQLVEKALFNELDQKEDHMKIDEKRVYDEFDIDDSVENEISDDFNSKEQSFRQKSNSFTQKSVRQKISNYLNVFVFKRKRFDFVDEKKIIEHRVKITRAMTTLLIHDAIESETDEWTFSIKSSYDSDHENKLVIFVSKTYEQVIKNSVWEKFWFEAIQAELNALMTNDTWNVVVFFEEVNIVTSKWIFKTKMHIDDNLKKLKIRFVVKNFFQIWKIDFIDIFASTFKFDTLRLFLIIVIFENLKCHQMNVNNAFTKSFLKKKIYMKVFFEVTLASSEIFQIRRSFYELKQTVKNWHEKCVQKFKKLSFEQMLSNSCFFRHSTRKIVFFVYVNDIDINARFLEQIKWFKKKFDKMFKIKDLKKIKKIFDIRITRDRKNRLFRMNQIYYLIEVLNELSMKVERHRIINILINDYDCIRSFNFFDERINVKNYQHVIEKVMWAVIHTRFDIAFLIERLSQFFSDLAK